MAAGYFEAGKVQEQATFEFSVRRLPPGRDFILTAGLPQAIDYLVNLKFEPGEIDYLRGLPVFQKVSSEFFDYLRDFRFTGDVFAVPEGTPIFAGEPILTLRAPIIEAQIPETYLLSTITFQSLIATKAVRVVQAAGGRDVVEFGTRRAHTPEAGTLGARAAYIGGCAGTSNTLAGYRYGIPIFGTAAHSWVLSFNGEKEAFRQLQKLLGDYTVQLVDTYDTLQGARRAIELGRPLWGVRLDSGDFALLARDVRQMLDAAGLPDAKIMVSGDLDENKIAKLIAADVPIDSFGVGTELATSADAPSMGAVYKLVEIDVHGITRYTAKKSLAKNTLPGAKQIFRFSDHDVIGRCGDCVPGDCSALQQPVMIGGHAVPGLPDVHQARKRAIQSLAAIRPGHRIEYTPDLQDLIERTRRSPV